ncbi:MAG TPA: hypothetical protein VGI94_19445, partial [Reyranella sp.]
MDLIDRYLESVRLLLPLDQRDDITAELRDILMTRREEKADALGRALTRQEDEALLKDFGHPLAVAGRYGPQQYLIGPELYPIFMFVLRLVLACVIGGGIIAGLTQGVIVRAPPHTAIRTAFETIWTGGFVSVGVVTVIFALLQRQPVRAKMFGDWSPSRDLPHITARPHRRPRWYDHVAAIVVQSIFMLWWSGWARFEPTSIISDEAELKIVFAPIWHALYWPVLGLSAAIIVVNALKLVASRRQRLTRVADMALQGGWLAFVAWLLGVPRWFTVTGAPAKSAASLELGLT